jgi:hypothetical protein
LVARFSQPSKPKKKPTRSARVAKLDYDEAESPPRFFNFLRKRGGEAPIHEDYGHQFCERLSEIY